MHSATNTLPVHTLERLVVSSVAVTATAIAEAAPDLTLLQWRVIVVLADARDGVQVSELARLLGSKTPAMSRLLTRLRRRNLVAARKDQADRRITTIQLTAVGRALWQLVVERRRVDLEDVLRRADLDDSGEEVLARVASAFGEGA